MPFAPDEIARTHEFTMTRHPNGDVDFSAPSGSLRFSGDWRRLSREEQILFFHHQLLLQAVEKRRPPCACVHDEEEFTIYNQELGKFERFRWHDQEWQQAL